MRSQRLRRRFNPRRSSAFQFARTAVPFGVLTGLGAAGLWGGGMLTQALVATASAVILTVGLAAGLGWLSDRYVSPESRTDTAAGDVSLVDRTEPLAADGSGEYR